MTKQGDLDLKEALSEKQALQDKKHSKIESLIRHELRYFATYSDSILSILEAVGEIHPFIKVAVGVFRVALNLLKTRQDNDRKVDAIYCAMVEMMSTLELLKEIPGPTHVGKGGMTIKNRMDARMRTIEDSIQDCAKLCQSYRTRHTAIKVLTSLKWRDKFIEVTEAFALHKEGLRDDIQLHISVGITSIESTLGTIDSKLSLLTTMYGNIPLLVKTIFEELRSQEERDMYEFIKKNGDVVGSEDPKLLEKILHSFPGRAPDVPGKRQKADSGMTVKELQEQLKMGVEAVIEENSRVFDKQWNLLRIQIDDVKTTVTKGFDQTIGAIREGPHDRITDPDIHYVWKEMGFKGSVKTRHLVMALRDHFSERQYQASVSGKEKTDAIDQIHGINVEPPEQRSEEIANVTNKVTAMRSDDEWALPYINVFRVQPLIEALDPDASTFVTVAEANAFTTARPQHWTLPHRLAYWTHGFELSVNWYRAQIIKLLAHISSSVNKTLPANRATVERFWQSYSFHFIDSLLAGFRDGDISDDIEVETDAQFLRFKDYILEHESSLRMRLSEAMYDLSDYDTLSIMLGQNRLETCILPLLRLLLERAVEILHTSETAILNDEELQIIDDSIYNVDIATSKRVNTLEDSFKLQNLDFKNQAKKFFFGMYYYYEEEDILNDYWKLSPDADSVLGSLADGETFAEESDYDTTDDLSNGSDGSRSSTPQKMTPPSTENYDGHPDSAMHDNAANASTTGDVAQIPSDGTISSHSQIKPVLSYDRSSEDGITMINGFSQQTNAHLSNNFISDESTHVLIGHWYGSYTYGASYSGRAPGGFVSFSVTSGLANGSFSGFGVDGVGEFSIQGSLGTDGVSFTKPYTYLIGDQKLVWEYRGTLSPGDPDTISGTWGRPSESRPADPNSANNASTTNETSITNSTDNETLVRDSPTYEDFHLGDFVLRRGTIEHLLFWPSDSELEHNRPRALWNFAYRAARRRLQANQLFWSVLKDRRDKRRKYIRLAIQKNTSELQRLGGQDLVEWNNLLQNIAPNDLPLWNAMAALAQRRRILHLIPCDGCDPIPIEGARLICLTCSDEEVVFTLDLCFNCMDRQVYRQGGHSKTHLPSHPLLQVRRILPSRYGYDARSLAQSLIRDINKLEKMSLKCAQCEKLVERRIWCCVTCSYLTHPTFVCLECNKIIEEAKPWQWEYRPLTDLKDKHNWAHQLVLIGRDQAPGTQTMEDKIHGRLDDIEASLSQNANRLNDIETSNANRLNDIQASLSQNTNRLNDIEASLFQLLATMRKQ